MRDVYDVIYAPVITEKSTEALESNVYTFLVNESANKVDIARAIEQLWDVTVEDVRTMRYAGKAKRAFLGRVNRNWSLGRRPSFKKAVVQLAEGDHIEFYEVG
ncbi:MAG: 50S ribosomal protein L23 [Gemmatimonadetes bacterium]|nr:MAG: 50S ribosomal protein L23 [Gemmatimonadota bacterium]